MTQRDLITSIRTMLNPRSVAIVGVPRELKTGKLFLIAIRELDFSGALYPVNPAADEIDGLKTYPSVSAIPGPLDCAIILVPASDCLSVVSECAEKGVAGAVIFTAGYRELGTSEGKRLEEALVARARAAGMRLMGPNCMGIYAPKSGLSFFPGLSKKPGSVGILSNSGSLANILCRMAPWRGLFFSAAVSLGNECDLTSSDFLAYFARDPDTDVIGAYLEGVADGPLFLERLRSASLQKPVILWKVGLTPEGSRAAASHTGALAGSPSLWRGIVNQCGAVPVIDFEAWVDTMVGFSLLPGDLGSRVAIISGPGGLAVAAAEACGREGISLATLSPETTEQLKNVIPPTGTSLANPVDVGMTASIAVEIYTEAARIVAADPGVDALIVIGAALTDEAQHRYSEAMIRIRNDSGKPFVMVGIPGAGQESTSQLVEAGLPCFETAERAIATCGRIVRYRNWKHRATRNRPMT